MRRGRARGRIASLDAIGFIAAPLASEAQDAGKVTRIGLLCAIRCEGPGLDVLRAGLRDLGWVEGRNLIIEARGLGGQLADCRH